MADLIEKTIKWKDTNEEEIVIFGIGQFNDAMDDQVFFWVQDLDELGTDLSPDFEVI